MDIVKPTSVRRNRKVRVAVLSAIGLIAVAAITVALARLKPADPTMEAASIWTGKVERGPMLRQVRGSGSLVPVDIRVIPAASDGQVERIAVQPGSNVQSDTVIIELSNPEILLAAQDADLKLRAAEADLDRLSVQLQSETLAQEAETARVESEYKQAKLRADADEELLSKGLISTLTQKLSRVTADELANRFRIASERLRFAKRSTESQLASQRAVLDQLRAARDLRRKQIGDLQVRAGIAGVLQRVEVELGQRVASGTALARVAEPTQLKAELKVPETQAKDIALGQKASVDTRNGVVAGTVSRIDPAAEQGTVTIDVAFTDTLPAGARPDLTVDGTIEIERLDDIVFVSRPVSAQPQSTVGLFKIVDGRTAAIRVQVRLGRASVNTVEVLDGLAPGDEVVLSDTNAWDGHDRVRLQ